MGEGGRIGPVDRFQRRWPVLGVPIAVIYKYVDDQATYLAVIVTYYALFAIFPLLLLATSILGFLLQGDPELQQRVLDSALSQFPVLGDHAGIVEASADSNADDEHDPEGATIAFERSQVEALARRLEEHLAELDAAAERLAAGTYGTCQRCGDQIPAGRLEARPAALTCVAGSP